MRLVGRSFYETFFVCCSLLRWKLKVFQLPAGSFTIPSVRMPRIIDYGLGGGIAEIRKLCHCCWDRWNSFSFALKQTLTAQNRHFSNSQIPSYTTLCCASSRPSDEHLIPTTRSKITIFLEMEFSDVCVRGVESILADGNDISVESLAWKMTLCLRVLCLFFIHRKIVNF